MSATGTELEPPRAVPVPTIGPPARRRWLRPGSAFKYVLLTAIAILFVAPFFYLVTLSFQPLGDMFSYPPQWIPKHPTIGNYTGFFTSDHPIGRWILNSTFVTITITVFVVFLNSLFAYTFAKRKYPGRDFLFLLGLATIMLPSQVTLIPTAT